jgi:hypothetical protein
VGLQERNTSVASHGASQDISILMEQISNANQWPVETSQLAMLYFACIPLQVQQITQREVQMLCRQTKSGFNGF